MNTTSAMQTDTLSMTHLTRSRDAPGRSEDFADPAALAFDEDRSENEPTREEIQAAWWDDDDDDDEYYRELGGSD